MNIAAISPAPVNAAPVQADAFEALRAAIPVIRTARLILRAPRIDDGDILAAYMGDDRSRMDGGPLAPDAAWELLFRGAGQWLLRGYGQWHVDDAESGRFIARIGVFHPPGWPEPELAWALMLPEAEGRGLALEGALAARKAAARIWGINRPISSIKPGNAGSIRLAQRLGARHEGDRDTIYGVMQTWRHPETTP